MDPAEHDLIGKPPQRAGGHSEASGVVRRGRWIGDPEPRVHHTEESGPALLIEREEAHHDAQDGLTLRRDDHAPDDELLVLRKGLRLSESIGVVPDRTHRRTVVDLLIAHPQLRGGRDGGLRGGGEPCQAGGSAAARSGCVTKSPTSAIVCSAMCVPTGCMAMWWRPAAFPRLAAKPSRPTGSTPATLAQFNANDLLTIVQPTDAEQEQDRDLLRTRQMLLQQRT